MRTSMKNKKPAAATADTKNKFHNDYTTNYEYALGSKKMQEDLTNQLIADSESTLPLVTVDKPEECRKYFRIIDFWNEQICKGMGWNNG